MPNQRTLFVISLTMQKRVYERGSWLEREVGVMFDMHNENNMNKIVEKTPVYYLKGGFSNLSNVAFVRRFVLCTARPCLSSGWCLTFKGTQQERRQRNLERHAWLSLRVTFDSWLACSYIYVQICDPTVLINLHFTTDLRLLKRDDEL